MPRRRMIDPDFWTDSKLAKASRDERLFFIGLFSNADDDGRIMANPAYLKSVIFPYDDDITSAQVKEMRDHLTQINPNIILYENAGEEYIQLKRWDRHQKPRYPKPSKFPPPPACNQKAETLPQLCNQKAESLQPSIVKDSIVKERTSALNMVETPTPTEKEILKFLFGLKNWKPDESEDLSWLREFTSEFPTFDLAHLKACRDYHSGRSPPKNKGGWKNRFRQWMIHDREFKAQRKDTGQRGARRVEGSRQEGDFKEKW